MLKIVIVKIAPEFVFEQYLHCFDTATQQKILSYRFHIDQVRSFTSEMLKHYYLPNLLNIPIRQISIKNTGLGKPVIVQIMALDKQKTEAKRQMVADNIDRHSGFAPGFTYNNDNLINLNNIHFNVSHSGDYVVMAVADKLIGIDIEEIDNKIDPVRLGETVFSHSENVLINGNINNFFMFWSKKEALFKAEGTGFINDYYNKTNLTLELTEEKDGYTISSILFAEKYYLSICLIQ